MNPFIKKGNYFEMNLIEKVRRYPYLYNSKDAHHVDAGLCLRTWQQIAAEMHSTTLQCKAKWRVLRCNFIRAYRQHAYKSYSEDTGDDFMKPKWVYFNQLMFLEPFIAKRRQMDPSSLIPDSSNNNCLHSSTANSHDIPSSYNTEDLTTTSADHFKDEPTIIELDDDNSQDPHLNDSTTSNDYNKSEPQILNFQPVSVSNHHQPHPMQQPEFIRNASTHKDPHNSHGKKSTDSYLLFQRPTSDYKAGGRISGISSVPDSTRWNPIGNSSVRSAFSASSRESPTKLFYNATTTTTTGANKISPPPGVVSGDVETKCQPGLNLSEEDELFGKFVGTVLSSISGRKKGMARMEIQQILFKYQYDLS